MPKMIVSLDGIVVKDVVLSKNRTTLGRRPYNDIVIDNLAVSGEHAVIQMSGGQVYIEDLNSTNGTNLNGKTIKREMLRNNDSIEIGKYKIKYFQDTVGDDFERTVVFRPGAVPAATPANATRPTVGHAFDSLAQTMPAASSGHGPMQEYDGDGAVRIVSGAAAGRQFALVKVVTTIGKIGVCVASITKRRHGFVLAHVEGTVRVLLNGAAVGAEPMPLRDQDLLELAGTHMQFVHL